MEDRGVLAWIAFHSHPQWGERLGMALIKEYRKEDLCFLSIM